MKKDLDKIISILIVLMFIDAISMGVISVSLVYYNTIDSFKNTLATLSLIGAFLIIVTSVVDYVRFKLWNK